MSVQTFRPELPVEGLDERVVGGLASSLHAQKRGDNALKSQSLTRSIAALTALQMGIDRAQPIAPALIQYYEAARQALLQSAIRFDPVTIARIQADFSELRQSLLDV